MAQKIKRRKCKHCKRLFFRKASKASSQKRWLQKPENQDYFSGPDNVERVQRWRKAHPGYWRRKQKNTSHALQDPLNQQLTENNDNKDDFMSHALQDSLTLQPTVLVGLIAQLTGYALQEDIAMAARRMQQLGNDILNTQHKGD